MQLQAEGRAQMIHLMISDEGEDSQNKKQNDALRNMLSNCTYDNLPDCRITFEILHAFIGRDTFNRKPSSSCCERRNQSRMPCNISGWHKALKRRSDAARKS